MKILEISVIGALMCHSWAISRPLIGHQWAIARCLWVPHSGPGPESDPEVTDRAAPEVTDPVGHFHGCSTLWVLNLLSHPQPDMRTKSCNGAPAVAGACAMCLSPDVLCCAGVFPASLVGVGSLREFVISCAFFHIKWAPILPNPLLDWGNPLWYAPPWAGAQPFSSKINS